MSNTEKKLFVITTNTNELYFVARTVDEKINDISRIIGSMFNGYVYGVIKHGTVDGAIVTDNGSMYIETSFVTKFIDLCIQQCLTSTLTLSSKNIKTINLFEIQGDN